MSRLRWPRFGGVRYGPEAGAGEATFLSGLGRTGELGPMQILPGRHAGFAVLELFGSEGPGPVTAWGFAQRLVAAEVDALTGAGWGTNTTP